jgi:putative transposase
MQRKYLKSLERKPRPRLPGFNYKGHYFYFITICCEGENEFFRSESTINSCLNTLRKLSLEYEVRIIAYCFMPDHLHLLLESGETTDMFKFVKLFKQITS